jgi:hypothetical protein
LLVVLAVLIVGALVLSLESERNGHKACEGLACFDDSDCGAVCVCRGTAQPGKKACVAR